MKSKNKLLFILLLFISFFIPTKQNASGSIYINSRAAIAVDYDSGGIYYGKNIDEEISLASISKIFSVYYFLLKMEEKGLTLDTLVKMSQEAVNIKLKSPEASGVYFTVNEEVTVNKLIELALVFSDNGATAQLAITLCGSEANFVNELNDYFSQNGYTTTHFVNASGLDQEIDGQIAYNKSTAREITRLTIEVLNKKPEILNYTKLESIEFNGDVYQNWDQMLPNKEYYYEGIQGLKTGSSNTSGYSYLGYCDNGKRTITLIIDGQTADGYQSATSRFSETRRLLDYVASQELDVIIGTDKEIKIPITNNSIDKDYFYPKRPLAVTDNSQTAIIFESIKYNPEYFDGSKLIKTIPEGETVATLVVNQPEGGNGTVYYRDGKIEVELVNHAPTNKENVLLTIILSVPRFLVDLFNSI